MAAHHAPPDGQHVYMTLLLNDSYLPGALVLAHSLRDARTTKQLAILVTLDSVSADSITKLKTVYDHILPVTRIRNSQPGNLYLMDRADLHSAFTKIHLWRQTQFSKIVYIDADVVAYRAPDELFAIEHAFSAAPDIGWPDLFNTGVMVLKPDMGEYYAMMAMAERGISFDGADQGLINMHFKNNHNRLSFTYNVTPSAHYQYVPAYRHFQSSINMVHFIGSDKPWLIQRGESRGYGSPYDEMIGRWWAVHDRHYRSRETNQQPEELHYSIKGSPYTLQQPAESPVTRHGENDHQHNVQSYDRGEHQSLPLESSFEFVVPAQSTLSSNEFIANSQAQTKTSSDQQNIGNEQRLEHFSQPRPQPPPRQISMSNWDAQRQPPPADSKPEAADFPSTHYEMSRDTSPFVPPARYPSPPKDMWYEVPKQRPAPPADPPNPIFPWESKQPRPSRSFAGHDTLQIVTEPTGSPQISQPVESVTPITPTIKVIPSDSWTTYSHINAWDEVPEIGRYVHGLHKHRRVRSQGSTGTISPGRRSPANSRSRSFKLTDFPTEIERPSLPVTPAPIGRDTFWGSDALPDGEGAEMGASQPPLPAAEGVPAQSEWNPAAQLQKLAQQQSETLLRRLAGDPSRGIPQRSLPFGSEPSVTDAHSITIGGGSGSDSTNLPMVHSPRPVKGDATTDLIRNLGNGNDEASIASTTNSEHTSELEQEGKVLGETKSIGQARTVAFAL